MRPVTNKDQAAIVKEWDAIAGLRAEQIETGRDLSFRSVLTPCILELSSHSDLSHVIDIGCGSGLLTSKIAEKATRVVGIDVSTVSIEIARRSHGHPANVVFLSSSVEDYARKHRRRLFSLAIANMVLMTVLDLDQFVKSVASLLKPSGHFIFTITHPCFWPFYWDYASKDWFDYKKETPIEAIFRISMEIADGYVTTHVHRPLEQYVSSLLKSGFIIDHLSEPMPGAHIEKEYPKPWKYPRFLAMRCIRMETQERISGQGMCHQLEV